MQKPIYDGTLPQFCGGCSCGCPVVEYDQTTDEVVLHDSTRPDEKVRMSRESWNTALQHLRPLTREGTMIGPA